MPDVGFPHPALPAFSNPTGSTMYVDVVSGSDTASGTQLQPKKTIKAAIAAAAAGTHIFIYPTGPYVEGTIDLTSAADNLVLRPAGNVRPVIDGNNYAANYGLLYNTSSAKTLSVWGLEVRNFNFAGLNWNGGTLNARGNVVHDIYNTVGIQNISGVKFTGSNGLIQDNVVYNVYASGEARGIMTQIAKDTTVERNLIVAARKEGYRDAYGLRNTFRDNVMIACWHGFSANEMIAFKAYNNYVIDCPFGFNPKHGNGPNVHDYFPSEPLNQWNYFRHNTVVRASFAACWIGVNNPGGDFYDIQSNLFVESSFTHLWDWPYDQTVITADTVAGSINLSNVVVVSGSIVSNKPQILGPGITDASHLLGSTGAWTMSQPATLTQTQQTFQLRVRGPHLVLNNNAYVMSGATYNPAFLYTSASFNYTSTDTTKVARNLTEMRALSLPAGTPFEANGTSPTLAGVGFANYPVDLQQSLVGPDLGDGYGTQVGARLSVPSVRWLNVLATSASASKVSANAIRTNDNNFSTYWNAGQGFDGPEQIDLDLGSVKSFNYLRVAENAHLSPQGIRKWDLLTSTDNVTFTPRGTFTMPDAEQATVHWPLGQTISARYLRFANVYSDSGVKGTISPFGGVTVADMNAGQLVLASDASSFVISGAPQAPDTPPPEPPPPPPPDPNPGGGVSGSAQGALWGFTIGAAPAYYVYYVSPTGSDSNDGRTSGAPWQTLAKVNATALGPGDFVLLQGGQSFAGPLVPPSSGAAGAPITFQSYGAGRATVTNTGSGHGCLIGARSHIVIDGINFTGPGAATSTGNGVQLSHATTVRPTDITVRNSDQTGWKRGVSLEFPSAYPATGYDNVLIEDCNTSANKDQGVASYGYDALFVVGRYPHSNVTVRRVKADNTVGTTVDNGGFPSGDGIVLGGVNGGLITLCRATNNGQSSISGPVGIWCFDSNAVVIDKCVSYNNGTNSASDGGGFDLDINCTGCTIQFCLAYDNEGYGILCYQDPDWGVQWNTNTIRWNVTWGNAKQTANHGELFISGSGVGSCEVYNNTFVAKDNAANTLHPPALALGIGATLTATGIHIRNNIFKQLGSGLLVSSITSFATSSVLLQGNAYDKAAATSVKWGATTYTSLATWRAAAAGQEQVAAANVGVEGGTNLVAPSTIPTATDPVVSRAVAGIHYNVGSPVQNAGLDLQTAFAVDPGTVDYEGSTLAVPYSIGAIK